MSTNFSLKVGEINSPARKNDAPPSARRGVFAAPHAPPPPPSNFCLPVISYRFSYQ
ncbi:MAG: hypothetical protein LBC77_04105 [Spirochaetaceae bacterium]|nr:hypothetical protein [Spirochaetaceae bacterium]